MPLYDAFISYSHAKDKPIASALQSVIQKLGKPWYRRRSLRVFRDDTSLSATPQLWPSIEKALGESRYLILLSSPESAASPWVGKEVEHWLKHKSTDALFIGATDGALAWDNKKGDFKWSAKTPLPKALKGRFAAEPKWVDLSAYREGANPRDARFIELGADFAAAIHGMPKEDLLSQEVRQQRRALTLAMGAAASLLVLAGAALWQWREAVGQRDRAEEALATATKGTNTLVKDVAIKFRDIAGVPIDSVSGVLDRTLELQQQLTPLSGGRADVLRSEALARRELATTLKMQGDRDKSLAQAEAARAIMQALVEDDPKNPELLRELSLSLNRVGEALSNTGHPGDREKALAAFEESLAIRKNLAASGDLGAQRDLALSHERVAEALRQLDRNDAATAEDEAALSIREGLARLEPEKTGWQLDLAVSYDKKGNLLLKEHKTGEALAAYETALRIRERVLAREPNSMQAQRDLSSSYVRLGEVLLKAGRRGDAVKALQKALPLREKLAQDRNNVSAQLDLVVALVKTAEAGDDPRSRIAQASEIVNRLDSEGKLPPDRKVWVADLKTWLASLPP